MSIDVNVQNDLVIVTETTEDIVVNVSNAVGPAGVGVPVGGATNQVLKKLSATNYDTYWAADNEGVPYSGATGSVNLGAFSLTANSIIKSGGTSSQFLKADGSVDSSVYITGITSGNVTTALGFTPVPTTRTLTINGTTLDLSADRSWTIAAGITGSGATGQVAYWNGATSQAGSNNFFWDNANGRLGIGTNVPTAALQIVGGFTASANSFITAGNLSIFTTNTSRRLNLQVANGSKAAAIGIEAGGVIHSVIGADTSGNDFLQVASRSGISFYSGSTIGNIVTDPTNERMRLTSAGRLLLGTTTESTFLLDVNGTAQINSSTYLATSSGSVGIGTATPAAKLHVDDGAGAALYIGLGTYNYYRAFEHIWQSLNGTFQRMSISSAGNLLLNTSVDSGERLQISGSVKATSFIKNGGTSSQYLMADGSVTTGGGGSVDELQVSLICQVFG